MSYNENENEHFIDKHNSNFNSNFNSNNFKSKVVEGEEDVQEETEAEEIKDDNEVGEDDREFIDSLFEKGANNEEVGNIQHAFQYENELINKQVRLHRVRRQKTRHRRDVVKTMSDTLGTSQTTSEVLELVCLPNDWRIPPR